MQGTCKLCLELKTLNESHAIANSVFKRIFRTNAGKGILLTLDEQDITYSSDSWWQHQLCDECEGRLNERYECYSLRVLRGSAGRVIKLDDAISFHGIDQHKLNMFFLSILWRASISRHKAYSGVYLEKGITEYLRAYLFNNKRIPIGNISVLLTRLYDNSDRRRFSKDSLKQLIVAPFFNGSEYCYAFEGFLVRISIPGIKLSERSKAGVIRSNRKILLIPFECIFDVPELYELIMRNYGKHTEGKSRINKNTNNQ